jgi:hypothetical protein
MVHVAVGCTPMRAFTWREAWQPAKNTRVAPGGTARRCTRSTDTALPAVGPSSSCDRVSAREQIDATVRFPRGPCSKSPRRHVARDAAEAGQGLQSQRARRDTWTTESRSRRASPYAPPVMRRTAEVPGQRPHWTRRAPGTPAFPSSWATETPRERSGPPNQHLMPRLARPSMPAAASDSPGGSVPRLSIEIRAVANGLPPRRPDQSSCRRAVAKDDHPIAPNGPSAFRWRRSTCPQRAPHATGLVFERSLIVAVDALAPFVASPPYPPSDRMSSSKDWPHKRRYAVS